MKTNTDTNTDEMMKVADWNHIKGNLYSVDLDMYTYYYNGSFVSMETDWATVTIGNASTLKEATAVVNADNA
jgi:hypothetical protein